MTKADCQSILATARTKDVSSQTSLTWLWGCMTARCEGAAFVHLRYTCAALHELTSQDFGSTPPALVGRATKMRTTNLQPSAEATSGELSGLGGLSDCRPCSRHLALCPGVTSAELAEWQEIFSCVCTCVILTDLESRLMDSPETCVACAARGLS